MIGTSRQDGRYAGAVGDESLWRLGALLLVGVSAYWIFAVGVPLLSLARGVGRVGAGLEPFYQRVVMAAISPEVAGVAAFTAWQAAWSVAISAALGLPLGIWVGAKMAASAPGSRLALALLAAPFGVPSVVAGVGWLALGLPFGVGAVVAAHVAFNAPWIAHWVARARATVPARQIEAVRTLGAGWAGVLRFVVIPAVRRPALVAALQSFSFCVMSFALVTLLGGGPPVETLETALVASVRSAGLDLAAASACALWQGVLGLAPWFAALLLEREPAAATASVEPPLQAPRSTAWLAAGGAALFLVPVAATLARLPRVAGWLTLDGPERAELLSAAGVSVALAGASAATALAVAGAAVAGSALCESRAPFWARAVSAACAVPAGLSALVLGLGFWFAYSGLVNPFEGSFWAIVTVQAATLLPIAHRALHGMKGGFPRARYEILRTLGASAGKAWRLAEGPRWRPAVLVLAGMLAALALGELAAVTLFYSERLVPLSLLVARWAARHRVEDARAAAALLGLLCVALAAVPALRRARS
ncbi:MAG: ABC transporter permease subunit [Bdellovibrionales bacterium]|nr:ABC transporter permease subunit [Bdellovibrionales bacterium]